MLEQILCCDGECVEFVHLSEGITASLMVGKFRANRQTIVLGGRARMSGDYS